VPLQKIWGEVEQDPIQTKHYPEPKAPSAF